MEASVTGNGGTPGKAMSKYTVSCWCRITISLLYDAYGTLTLKVLVISMLVIYFIFSRITTTVFYVGSSHEIQDW